MTKVLLVDDELRILEALERTAIELADDWDVTTATGGAEALAELGRAPFDVIVSDMRMPGMDGAELLERVQMTYPRTLRFALSGQTERGAAMRALRAAHQFIGKPCPAEALIAIVERALALRAPLDEDLALVAARVDRIPTPSAICSRLLDELELGPTSTGALAEIVASDPGMTAKVLQIAGSAFFGRSAVSYDVRAAVDLLGVDGLRFLTLDVGAFVPPWSERETEATERHQREAFDSAIRARATAGRDDPELAYVRALLANVGAVVAACVGREDADQARLGACILGWWGLPSALVAA